MIRIKALNEDVDTSDSETEEPENGLLTREAQEENLQQLYCEALKLVDSDKEQAKSELISLLDTLDEFDESSGLTNIVHLKYLSLKNLGLLFPDNLNYFLDALAIDGGDVTLWIETGRRALNQFTNLPLARTCFEEAHRISPTNWVVLDILMGLYYVLNDYSNCLKLAIKGLTKDCHYFKACLLISEMVKHFPSIGSELPANLQYLHNWNPCEKDLERKEKILAEFSNLKEKRKRKFLEDETNQNDGRKVFTLNLESTSLSSLQSLTSTLKKIYTEMEKANCPRSTFISIESGTSSDDVQSADENMSDEYSDKEKLNNKPEKRGSFPFEFIDKRRSSRVQKIQNKTSDSCEFSSDNIYEKVFSMIPQSILSREVEVKRTEIEIPKYNETQVENLILSRFISKQKSFKSKGKRIDQLINDFLFEVADQANLIKLPSNFIDLYKIHRQMYSLPSPLTCSVEDVSLEEIKLITTANEIEFQQSEAIFLTQMLPHLRAKFDSDDFDGFFIRLLTLRGIKESKVDYLLMANEVFSQSNLKLVQASNQTVYSSSSLKSIINTLNENNLDKLLDQHRHEELVELLASKSELSEPEEEYLCQAIQSSQEWKRGVEIISRSKQLTDRLLKLLRSCLKNGDKLSIDRELAIKLLKLGTEKYSAMAWTCLVQTFINEISSGEIDEKKIINLINTVHVYLSRRGACSQANGEFLLLALDFTINQCSKAKDDLILQCFACLYNHPPPRPGYSYLTAHPGAGIDLLWDNVDTIYSYFIPEKLPEFDSVKRDTIDSDTEELLRRILPLIPDNLNPETDAKLINEYLDNGKPIEVSSNIPKHHVTQHLYYFLADYYFKNKEFQKAKKFYIYDLTLNRDRFDSWAACALSITHLIEQYFSNGSKVFYSFSDEVFDLAESAFRCYIEALRLEPNNTKIWIEYGNLAYNVASYISRVRKSGPTTEGEQKEKMIKQQKRMLYRARVCFESANNVADADEIWLHYYFLGKIAERSNILQALKYYELSDLHLALSGATYPRKIGYHNPTRYAIEALEIHYRMHACVLKYIRRHSKTLSSKILSQIKIHLLRALRSPFVKQIQIPTINSISDHDYISSDPSRLHPALSDENQIMEDVKEVVTDLVTLVDDGILESDERQLRPSIMEMCLEAMNRCLQRFPNHYKSLYRMAHHFCSLKDFLAARVVLLGRFTTSSGSQSLLKKPESPGDMINGNGNASTNGSADALKSEPIIGLFGDHKNNNLFNGIWRIPVDDIDRPGSFITHMCRSTHLLIKVSWALSDPHRLSTIAVQLSKTPEVGKKFLRDIDREHLAKDALRRCFSILKNRIEEARQNRPRLDQIRIDLRKVAEKLMKCSVYQRDTQHFIGECEQSIRSIVS